MSTPTPGVACDASVGVRFDAALHLHARICRVQPGGDSHEIADLALTLVLNPRREAREPAFLARNAWRNARTLLNRRRRRVVTDPLGEDTPLGAAIARGALPGAVRSDTPLDHAIARDLERRIRQRVGIELGSRGERVLDALLAGASTVETARAVGTSTRTVERLRRRVREIAASVVDRRAA